MRRLIGWLAGLAGVAALARVLHRRRQPSSTSTTPEADAPAEALRRKLAEARAGTATATEPPAAPEDAEGAETSDEQPDGPSIEERRADVHARAQAAIDAMQTEPE